MCAPPGEAGSGCDGRDKESLAPRPGGQEEAWGTSRHGETLPRRSMRTAHRVALVTGANRGIGLEVCRQLAQHGYAVVLGSRDAAKGERAAAGLAEHRRAGRCWALGVSDPASSRRAAARGAGEFGRLA